MSYQVLARKWRPQTFHELVGQSHVKQALVNALTQNRLHHAYLFTGTRGVGKTTIARIFAKSLNCDEGISAQPCGQCSSCKDIEAGRYIDLLEIDAASRTKVEDTREILDNVQYAPTRGRYKVYLIDEVHMLSKHSFNALLKTLEEPPEHVKFLLATTDPQKLPVTILSRCLQFNLNALSQSDIHTQLAHVLGQENLSFDDKSLTIIAKAADGSMRDALSLTDQAIAQTNGQINHQAVQSMLGLMDTHHSQRIIAALLCQDGEALLAEVATVASQSANFTALLDDLIALTHLVQLVQLVPQAAALDEHNQAFIHSVATSTDAQQIQVYYQLLLNGKKDLQWAPDAKLGFEMIMLRLLAFEPSHVTVAEQPQELAATATTSVKPSGASALREILNKKPPPVEAAAQIAQPNIKVTTPSQVTQQAAPDNTVTPLENEVCQTQIQQPSSEQSAAPPAGDFNSDDYPDAEQNIAAQFADVMADAQQQGFQGSQSNAEHSATVPTEPLQQQENKAQSAIARILQDRNISGAGTLSGGQQPHAEKAPSASDPLSQADEVKKPQPQLLGESKSKTKAHDFKSKHQTVTANLAPELLAQINPQKPPKEQEVEPAVAVPDDFQSPISSIKFAHQQDEWAYLIKRMRLGGRMRQFALHSIFTKNDQQLHIDVDASQKHLDSPILRQKLNAALSEIYGHNVELTIEFADGVIDSPYLIQQKIDAGRHQQAIDVINNDTNIVQFQQLFSAIIDENSIQAL
ncbi:DNA polymerase III subunit gamma/tau [Pseudoalteromonas mariniglutinosa]|uniref:DNA polymerase III subunit gamma/tau n=1 Tax=Pseudoalteromonas mariniglutinosa TaxID=206042 RepID=UPI00384F55A9